MLFSATAEEGPLAAVSADRNDDGAKPDAGTAEPDDGVVDLTSLGSGDEGGGGGGGSAAVPRRHTPRASDPGPADSPRCSDGR